MLVRNLGLVGVLGAVLVLSAAACSSDETGGGGAGGTGAGGTGAGGTGAGGTGAGGTGAGGTGAGGTGAGGTGGSVTGGGGTGGAAGGAGGSGGAGDPVCGDDNVQGLETCDGSDLDGNDCTTLGGSWTGGTLACNDNCLLWDVSGCTVSAPVCGNDVAENFEACDGTDLGSFAADACTDYGYTGGSITCTACQVDFTSCTGGQAGWTCDASYYDSGFANDCDCGCGVFDPDCADATAGSCDYCSNYGSCNGYDVCGDPGSLINASDNSSCDGATCSNDIAEAFEICDGTDLRGFDCVDVGMGFAGGTLACTNCSHDTSNCTSATCGDDLAEGFEWCDGSDLAGWDCENVGGGFDGGTLTCSSCNLDTSACTPAVCGDNTAAGYEYCDGTDMGGVAGDTCADWGFTGGDIDCTVGCLLDFSTCTGGTDPAWTCPESYYDSGFANDCDCGCGALDPDCADATVGSCDYCNDPGSCNPNGIGCPGIIDASDNSACN